MDREEFADFLLQSGIKPLSGRMIRLTLVRSVNTYISSKISNERYINIKSIHLEGNYRMMVTNFTHSEYSNFRKDFNDEVDFLRFSPSNFNRIVREAFENNFELIEFFSRGNGRISIKSPVDGNRSQFLLLDMENREKEGFYPYMVKLRGRDVTLRVRADCNFFLSKLDRNAAILIYQIAKLILSQESETYERLSRFRYPNWKQTGMPALMPEYVKLHPSHTQDNLKSLVRRWFNTVSDDMGNAPITYITERNSGEWIATLRFLGDVAELVPGRRPNIDSFLTLLEILTRDGTY